ncbi:MAG: response regulator [Phormidesmis sp.]
MSATKVMIVEDESVIALDIKSSLNRLGYAVSGIAASGDAALRKIKTIRPDLVLMDIHLKGEMTGIEVSEQIKSDFQIPIVYLTANADSSTFQEAKGTDPYAYILKPFEEKELGIAIEIALHQHQKSQTVSSSERWYATAFQSLNEAVIATDPDGLVVFMNAAAELIADCRLADVIDRSIADVLMFQRLISQFERVDLSGSVSSILAAVMRGRTVVPFPHNVQVVARSFKTTPIEGSATAIRDAKGSILGSIFVFKQIEEIASDGSPVRPATADWELLNERMDAQPAPVASHKSQADSDDMALVQAFTRGFINKQPVLLSTPHLIADASSESTTLANKTEGVIVSVKLINGKLTAIVRRDSAYWELVRHVLVENNFFPVSQRTNGTHYYQHRTIPERCQIYHTSAKELWEAWHGKVSFGQAGSGQETSDRLSTQFVRASIIVLRRGAWYHIQKLVCTEDSLHIKTIGGEMFTALDDSMVWGLQS